MAILLNPPPEIEAEARSLAAAGRIDEACGLLTTAVRAALAPEDRASIKSQAGREADEFLARWTKMAEETARRRAALGLTYDDIDDSREAMYGDSDHLPNHEPADP